MASVFLGQESSEKTEAAQALAGARGAFQRVSASYEKLALSMGKDSADEAVNQAAESLKKAQETYDSLGG